MSSDLILNRISISDRYPMLGFTLKVPGGPALAEVTLVSDPALLRDPAGRSPETFFSTRSLGPLQVTEGEAVYIVPAEVMARFVGAPRLYFALAVSRDGVEGPWSVEVLPDADSVYVTLAGLTGRSLRRVRVFPDRPSSRLPGYGGPGEGVLSWAGDEAPMPGPDLPEGAADGVPEAAPVPYNDGFGDLPPLSGAEAAALGTAGDGPADVTIGARRPGLAPETTAMGPVLRGVLEGLIATTPALGLMVAAARLANREGLSVGLGIAGSAGFAAGGSLGAGIIFAPGGALGVYGAAELDLGAIFSASATVQVTVLRGGVAAFGGITQVAGFSAGEGIVGGGVVIFDAAAQFLGVSFEIGIGLGSPLDVYVGVQRAVARELSAAHGSGSASVLAGDLGAGSDPRSLEVKYRMFIPSPAISGAPVVGDFGGDDRGFSYDGGSSRGEIVARVQLTPGMGIERVDLLERHWGTSKAYDRDDTHAVAGKPDWWVGIRDGAAPTRRETLQASDHNLKVVRGTSGKFAIQAYLETAAVVSVRAEGALPLLPLSPDIDVDMGIFFRQNGGRIQAKAVGRHDGFPCHELYVNGRPVYRYDPVAANAGPGALVGWGDVEANGDWVDVATVSRLVRARVQGIDESFTINWDGVAQIAQPSEISCWAAAAAMVVGWRDHQSLSPERLAEIVQGPVCSQMDVGEIGDMAEELGLVALAGQSFTVEVFRDLLEANGPLWVGIGLPGSRHAVVVTGMYSDEAGQILLRITDPWDRIVGQPGQPGSYQASHREGSRYIMTWEAFEAQFAAYGMHPQATFQILHAGGPHGHRLNRGETAPPPGYAAGLAINESFTINWDALQRVPQPNAVSCWAAAAAMLVGWRDHQSLSPAMLAEIAGRPVAQGLDPEDVGDLSRALGLTAVAGQSFTPAGFRDLLEENGPLWVGVALPGSLHAVVVTGMYNDEAGQILLRITDPWDRIVGQPGQPGAHKATHREGSRYIMTWEAFEAQYAAMGHLPQATFQILHANGPHGHRLNRGETAPPPGYAAALGEESEAGVDAAPGQTPEVTLAAVSEPIAAVAALPLSGPNGVPVETRWRDAAVELLGAAVAERLDGLPDLARARGWSVAAGPDGPAGFAAPGVGIGPEGTVFRYGPAPGAAPEEATAGGVMLSLAEGGPERFGQWHRAQAYATGEGASGAVLIDAEGLPVGLALRLAPWADPVADLTAIADAVTAAYVPPEAADPATPEVDPAQSALAAALQEVAAGAGAGHAGPALGPGASPVPPVMPPELPPELTPVAPPGVAGEFPPPGVSIHRSDVERNGVSYGLFLMDGAVRPVVSEMADVPLLPGPQIVLDDWPYLDGPGGRSKGGVVIDWSHGAGAVGNVRSAPSAAAALDGWAVAVTTDLGPGPETGDGVVKLIVSVRTRFTKPGAPPRTGLTLVTFYGDGSHELTHRDESPATVDAAAMA